MLNQFGIALALSVVSSMSGMMIPDMDSDQAMPGGDPNEIRAEMPETKLPGRWLSSFDEAKQLATTHQLPLVIHFEAPWCGACRTMDASVMNEKPVTEALSQTIVGVRVNADESPDLISRFGIASLPTEVVIAPDGTELGRYVGGTSLSSYVARLKTLSDKVIDPAKAESSEEGSSAVVEDENLRECLIVKHDGKMVGLGGYSPVALLTEKQWKLGSEQFVAEHQGVTYFFQTEDEKELFGKTPSKFIPELHGCDLVELSVEKRAEVGAIEYGAFYKGRMFFFASLENRQKFQKNPAWYAEGITTGGVENPERFPFLPTTSLK
ncbi:MAG: thioredoxin family protein [Planctomyces sp.]|nr:thioredoxin family protein [Planctomyces sp.]